jgi:hypothetical protein
MTHDGRTLRMLTMIDEYTRECLAIRVLLNREGWKVGKYLVERAKTHSPYQFILC